MKSKLRNTFVVVASSAVMLLGGGVPAFADQGDVENTCPDNNICMWEDNNFGGNKWVEQSARDGKTYNIDWFNGDNEISSVRNTSGLYVCVYPGDNPWGGGYIVIQPETEHANLAQAFGFDNQAESLKIVRYTSDCN